MEHTIIMTNTTNVTITPAPLLGGSNAERGLVPTLADGKSAQIADVQGVGEVVGEEVGGNKRERT